MSNVDVNSSLHILHIFICSIVNQLPGQFATKIEQVRNNVGVFCPLDEVVEYDEVLFSATAMRKANMQMGHQCVVQVPSMGLHGVGCSGY